MDAYTEFSKWYDELMEDVPYDEWFDLVKEKLSENGIKDGLVCELGAGTGNFTMRLAEAGYDMIGIDNSDEMLAEARTKKEEYLKESENSPAGSDNKVSDIMYICQDMREFELYGTVNAIVSICDSINYILEDEEMIHIFKLVNNYLDPKGLFVFDFNTVHKYRDIIGDSTIADSNEEVSFIWSNYFDEETKINEYEVTFFVKAEPGKDFAGDENVKKDDDSDLYKRFVEYHYQRGYTLEEIKDFLKEAGLVFIEAFDADGFGVANEDSERIFVIARESGK
ncbi:MAG: class I SAM-dependent methyltransferase [Lachnospiraceae bacterium]|nr:class I SAM-dependent methyltransferase [Lachnospiraceae bacterium]